LAAVSASRQRDSARRVAATACRRTQRQRAHTDTAEHATRFSVLERGCMLGQQYQPAV
jgi:hypothetical protein